MEKYRLGIDIGTSNIKAVITDFNGKIINFASQKNKLFIHNNFVEQEPDQIWNSVVKVIKKVTNEKFIKKNLVGISFSTQGGTIILLDKNKKPLRRAITWMDTRAIEENKILIRKYGRKFFYNITGWEPSKGCLPLSQLLWIKRNQKEIFDKIYKIHFVDSYLIYKLTGKEITDYTNSAITMLFDIKEKKWSKDLLNIIRINEELLPNISPSGTEIGYIKKDVVEMLELNKDTKIFSGGHDQYCSALGVGLNKPGECLLSAGTAWVLLVITKNPVFSTNFSFSPGPHVINGLWGALTSIPYGGASYEWFLKNILFNKFSYKEIEKELIKIEDDFPCFKPFFSDNKPEACFLNIKVSHTPFHFIKGIMEGIAYQVKKKIDQLKSSKIDIEKIKMVGGCSKNQIWRKILSKELSIPIYVFPKIEAASLGASFLVKYEI